MRVVLFCLLLLLGLATALEPSFSAASSPRPHHRGSPHVHASPAFTKFRSLSKVEKSALSTAGFQLGDCGPLCELDLPGIIAFNGYPVETHTITAIDG